MLQHFQRYLEPPRQVTGKCDIPDGLYLGACFCVLHTFVYCASRLLTPILLPKVHADLSKKPGQVGFWSACVASSVNGTVNAVLAALVVYRTPGLLWQPDFFYKNTDTCHLLFVFMAWIMWELCLQLLHINVPFGNKGQMFFHHVSAMAAWLLYLYGGWGHLMSVNGTFCEATNPFMNMRYFLSTAGMKSGRVRAPTARGILPPPPNHPTAPRSHPTHAPPRCCCTQLYFINGLAFVFVWLVVRILMAIPYGPYLFYNQWEGIKIVAGWRGGIIALIGYFLLYCVGAGLNMMWGHKLFSGAISILFKGEHPKAS